MTSLPEIVALMHRADWTKLSLSADVEAGHLLIAPGGRCRFEQGSCVNGRDGKRTWALNRESSGEIMTWGGLNPPFAEFLDPATQLSKFVLEYLGDEITASRRVHHLIAAPRTLPGLGEHDAQRVDLFVDAELGIVVRRTESFANAQGWSTELSNLRVDPPEADDANLFVAPEGVKSLSSFSEMPGMELVRGAASVAAAGLGVVVRFGPEFPWRRQNESHDADAVMPQAEPEPPPGDPLTDAQLYLLHRSGTGETVLSAIAYVWTDSSLAGGVLRSAARGAGVGGLRVLAGALERRAIIRHTITSIRFGSGGRYLIERLGSEERKQGKPLPKKVVSDGERRWQVFADRAIVGTAKSPGADLGKLTDLLDPSWLLSHWLSDQAEAVSGGRAAVRFRALRRGGELDGNRPGPMFHHADVTLDAELGVISRLILYWNDKPVRRAELRELTAGTDASFDPDLPPGLLVEQERPSARDFRAARATSCGTDQGTGDGGGT